MRIYYFETSAINYLLKNVRPEVIKFLRDFLTCEEDAILSLSPVSMWEIACTPDMGLKDELIHVCQLLFDETKLFPSPAKILDVFMDRGCKLEISLDGFFNTDCWVSHTWREIASDEEKTILVDGSIFVDDRDNMKRVSRILRDLIRNDFTIQKNYSDEYYNAACELVNTMFNQVEFIQEDRENMLLDDDSVRQYKVAIFFAICILVLGIHTDNEERIEFWKKRKISDDIREQLCYLFHQNGTILHRGPLVYMADMAISEVKEGTNRGLYKDCLHAVYMPYCTTFFTHDKHFLEIAKQDTMGLWNRIVDIEQICKNVYDAIEEIGKEK